MIKKADQTKWRIFLTKGTSLTCGFDNNVKAYLQKHYFALYDTFRSSQGQP
jgi:hypothetical protein